MDRELFFKKEKRMKNEKKNELFYLLRLVSVY